MTKPTSYSSELGSRLFSISHWAIRNCGNSSIQSTEQSWGSAATTRPELLHPSCVASALPPARHLLYRKSTKSNRQYLCSSSARPVLRSIRPRHPTTTTAATFFINPLVTTPSVIVTIITVDACSYRVTERDRIGENRLASAAVLVVEVVAASPE